MQFDFGNNWKDFSDNALTDEKIQQARDDFRALTESIEIEDKSFLDIGFGQGLSLLIAAEFGARCIGCDINTTCAEVLEYNRRKFPNLRNNSTPLIVGSILDNDTLMKIGEEKKDYDIVHSWGVLHHTGDMYTAIENSARFVKPGGAFILAIYNRHWTSKIWLEIKRCYNKSPNFVKKLFIIFFIPVIWIAKFVVTGKNPKKQKRGMDFYYNVIDWIGGYPYEYASKDELVRFVEPLGFQCRRVIGATVPTGCNQFIFFRINPYSK